MYLRDIFDVRRMYESPISYKVDVLGRTGDNGPLDTRRAVMVAVEMRDGKIIRYFNRDVMEGGGGHESPHARKASSFGCCPTNRPRSSIASITSFECFVEAVVIVIIVGLFLMDWRSALVLATAVPLTVAMTLGRHANAAYSLATNLHRRAHHRPGHAGGRAGRGL